jgi:hypothetical protein
MDSLGHFPLKQRILTNYGHSEAKPSSELKRSEFQSLTINEYTKIIQYFNLLFYSELIMLMV